MKTFMFPGQGSQARGMGGALFEEFSALTAKADQVLGYSIKELCLEDPRQELGKTQFTQPALFVVNALSYYKRVNESGSKPDFVAGHSLGEFNALLAAGCFDFETGLKIVKQRGELMSRISNGAMAAITNATSGEITALLEANGLSNIDLANYNSPSQIVISGDKDEVARAQALFQGGKMNFFPLNTSGAFHSRYMSDASNEFAAYLEEFEFSPPQLPVIANVTARPYLPGEIRSNLAKQMAGTVKWSESVQYLLAIAAAKGLVPEFDEIGHGNVLAKLVAAIKRLTPPEVLHQLASDAAGSVAQVREIETLARSVESNVPITTRVSAAEKVSVWNKTFAVGTRVRSILRDKETLETRTPAIVLFGHRAAIYLKGYNGYFDLDEIVPA